MKKVLLILVLVSIMSCSSKTSYQSNTNQYESYEDKVSRITKSCEPLNNKFTKSVGIQCSALFDNTTNYQLFWLKLPNKEPQAILKGWNIMNTWVFFNSLSDDNAKKLEVDFTRDTIRGGVIETFIAPLSEEYLKSIVSSTKKEFRLSGKRGFRQFTVDGYYVQAFLDAKSKLNETTIR